MEFLSKLDKLGCAVWLHDWTPWKVLSPDRCVEEHSCKKCAASGQRVNHLWSEWQYIKDASCEQQRNCARCAEANKKMANHQWSGWKYLVENDCSQENNCQRCGQSNSRTNHQRSSNEVTVGGVKVGVASCPRCGGNSEYKFGINNSQTTINTDIFNQKRKK